MTVLWSI